MIKNVGKQASKRDEWRDSEIWGKRYKKAGSDDRELQEIKVKPICCQTD